MDAIKAQAYASMAIEVFRALVERVLTACPRPRATTFARTPRACGAQELVKRSMIPVERSVDIHGPPAVCPGLLRGKV